MANANFVFFHTEADLSAFADYRRVSIDGRQTTTTRQFLEQIKWALEFPEDFKYALDEFDELLNDLSWLDDDRIALIVTHTNEFLAQEKSEKKKVELLTILDASAEDWKWPDEEEAEPKTLIILFEENKQLRTLLEQEGFYLESATAQ